MTDKIVDKLRAELAKPITTEPQVVYLLVEIRKLLERDTVGGFGTLKLYCNWAVHATVERGGAVDLLKTFDDIEDAYQRNDNISYKKLVKAAETVLGTKTFQLELKGFLKSRKLDTALCDNEEQWRIFLEQYIKVIEDIPVEFKQTHIKHVKNLTVRLINDRKFGYVLHELTHERGKKNWHFALEWSTKLFNGTKGKRHVFHFTSEKENGQPAKQTQPLAKAQPAIRPAGARLVLP